jgi:hypothetical protein
VVGGFVYRGSIPELQGKYIFGEFSWGPPGAGFYTTNGRLLAIDPFDDMGNIKDPSEVSIQELSRGDSCSQTLNGLCTLDMALLGIGTDEDGELYAIGVRGTNRSIVYKIVDAFYLPEGDYNEDGTVDDDDYTVWRAAFGATPGGSQVRRGYGTDGNADGVGDAADYVIWRKHFGESTVGGEAGSDNVPEPCTLFSAVVGLLGAVCSCRR